MRYLKISFLLFAFLFSCKKKDDTAPSTSPAPSSQQAIDGNLQSDYYIYDYGNGNVQTDSVIIASFFASPATATAPTCISAGTVSVNGTILKYETPQNLYIDSTHTINMQEVTFNATGAGTITAFTYSYVSVCPKLTAPMSLGDTCFISNGITITVPAVNNTNAAIRVSIYQGNSTQVVKTIGSPSGGSVTFTSADLSAFVGNYPITISLNMSNLLPNANVGASVYGVTCGLNYMRFCYLKN